MIDYKQVKELLENAKSLTLDEMLGLPEVCAFQEACDGRGMPYAIVPFIDRDTGNETYYIFKHIPDTENFVKVTQYYTGVTYSSTNRLFD